MPWKEVRRMSEKERFVEEAGQPGVKMSRLCKAFGISRKTGYKYLRQFKQSGKKGLHEASRQPRLSPNKTSANIEQIILGMRDRHPQWGGVKIEHLLKQQGVLVPCPKTINRILKKHGRISPEESLKR